MLEDASAMERALYELSLFANLLRAAAGAEEKHEDEPDPALITAPSVRTVSTRWDWDAFAADPTAAAPNETRGAWVIRIPPAGPLQTRRLHPLPTMLLEICAEPRTRAQAAELVSERIDGEPERIAALVRTQMDELRASGILVPAAPERAEETVGEMRRLLLADEAPQSGARGLVGLLARAAGATREYAADALEAEDDPYPPHLLDVSVNVLEQLLAGARLRALFAAELEGYWRGADAGARVRALRPLLDVLDRALGGRSHALTPYVLAE